MSNSERVKTILVTCSVLLPEVLVLRDKHWPGVEVRPLTSMLHMHPEKLGARLEPIAREGVQKGERLALVYGDCFAKMAALEQLPGVSRTAAHNCCELLLGPAEYRQLLREGAFFLLPEWARRWREVFRFELGLDQTNARSLMQDMHTRLVYLETGIQRMRKEEMEACAAFCGLPLEIRPVTLEPLREAIQRALDSSETSLVG